MVRSEAWLSGAALVLWVLAASCAAIEHREPGAFDTAPLLGMVYDDERRPVQGARVLVGEESGAVYTDIEGRFILPEVDRGQGSLVVEHSHYEAVRRDILFHRRTDVVYVTLTSYRSILEEARLRFLEGSVEQTRALLERVSESLPGDPSYLLLSASLRYRDGDLAGAREFLEAMPPSHRGAAWRRFLQAVDEGGAS